MQNRACCWVIAILGIFVILFFILAGVFITTISGSFADFSGSKPSPLTDESYLVLNLTGALPDYDAAPSLGELTEGRPTTMHSLLQALDHAANDDKIKGIVLKPMGMAGLASIREVREAVRDFKESDKPVYAYLEVATDRDYYLATIADSIFMMDTYAGGLVLEGVGLSSTYMAKTFEKIGITFNVFHAGEFKGAFENLSRDSMSEPLRESLEAMVNDLFDNFYAEMAADRDALAESTLMNEVMAGESYLIHGHSAVDKGFADELTDWQQFKRRLQGDEDEFPGVGLRKYLRSVSKSGEGEKKIAVVYAEGEVVYDLQGSGGPFEMDSEITANRYANILRDLREDEDIAAVVLRVNSPGGSALASKIILDELLRLKEVKPVVASMARVAASGGYYISCGADEVFAQPGTITGSIGVVAMLPNLAGLYDKIDAKEEVVKRGKWSQFFRLDEPMTPEQHDVIQTLIEGVYDEFLMDVAAGREISRDTVSVYAQGRIWTGAQALERGLIDELGGLSTAIEHAATLADMDSVDYEVEYYPESQDFASYILDQILSGVHSFVSGMVLTPEAYAMREALEYVQDYMHNREFLQAVLPLRIDI